MHFRCNTRGPSPSGPGSSESGSSEPGWSEPVLAGPADAAAVIRLSALPAHGPAIVVLLCDSSHRLILAVAVENASPSGVPRAVDLVLAVARSGGVRGIVVGIVQARLRPLPATQARALDGLAVRCGAAGVDLLEVLVVGPRSFRSVLHLAGGANGGEDGAR